ncbi:RNA-guided pseudouridylation complex pseudouridine synthase subunit Cbf5 [Natronomonas sp. EA1]|uniref:RNA-guided pseudouridylation complex pseudouridine synthase subunit Cbf5 n=1 Tax=Natronomonas sp. EA1 TaxID=3421655 RepID=UPI003EBB6D2D
MRPAPADRTVEEVLSFGVVNLDKPPGPSAHQVAGWLRDMTDVERAAHSGTLDPKVTGCLPVLLGDATRAAQIFDDAVKEYVTVFEAHGRIPDDFPAIAAEFETEIYQKPPRKSAVSRRLRSRRIHAIDILETEARRALLRIRCESGTYIRKLCHDLGLALGTGAHMGALRRTATGGYTDASMVTMHDVADALAEYREEGDDAWLREVVAPAEEALDALDLPHVVIAPSAAEQVAEGAPVYAPGVIDCEGERGEQVACYTPNGAAVCLGTLVGDPEEEAATVVDLDRVLV